MLWAAWWRWVGAWTTAMLCEVCGVPNEWVLPRPLMPSSARPTGLSPRTASATSREALEFQVGAATVTNPASTRRAVSRRIPSLVQKGRRQAALRRREQQGKHRRAGVFLALDEGRVLPRHPRAARHPRHASRAGWSPSIAARADTERAAQARRAAASWQQRWPAARRAAKRLVHQRAHPPRVVVATILMGSGVMETGSSYCILCDEGWVNQCTSQVTQDF